jgi:hypothetical protein
MKSHQSFKVTVGGFFALLSVDHLKLSAKHVISYKLSYMEANASKKETPTHE